MMNNRKYKIVYCTPALYSAGGVERVISVKASYFADVYGYDVTIIVTEGQGRECFFPLSDKVRVINLQLAFEDLWRASFLKKVLLYFKKQRRYKQLLSTELMRLRPDITISVLRREINFINSIPDGSRKIGELHVNRSNYRSFTGCDSNIVKRQFARFWMKNLIGHLKQLDRMVVLTESAQKDWSELSNVTLIPDPLPFTVDEVSSLTFKRVTCIGRYAYEKGNDLLLRAWAKIQDSCDDWELDIYGVGDQTPYRHIFQELGVDDRRCHLHNSISDVKEAYLRSSLFALPSRFEGFSLVAIEAMACGLPVVSYDCENGPRNIIRDGQNGFLVHPFDVDVFADRLLMLIRDEELRHKMGAEARQSSRQYQIEDIALRWKSLFEEVMGEQ
jgi:glycosyltransferase involved in cell wall biosynthesis